MKYLPLGLNVRDKKCVVVGGGRIGARKVENLLRAGAAVELVAPEASPALLALAESGRISWLQEPFREAHLRGALLAVAATDDEALNAQVVAVAADLGALGCDASAAERSEFIFGALHESEGTTIAVFSDGLDPSRSRRTRNRIAAFVSKESRSDHESLDQEPVPSEERSMLILMAHGSRDPRWRGSLETLTRTVGGGAPDEEVALAFMQFTGPTLEELVEDARSRGVRVFRILPLFMASAGHVDKDIRPLVAELSGRYPDLQMDILTPVGEDPRFQELVKEIAANDRS